MVRRLTAWHLLAALLLVAAVACAVIAAATWQDLSFEGAYLNRSISKPAYSGVISTWSEPNEVQRILVGAAIGLGVSSVLVLATSLMRARRRPPRPPAPAGDPAP